MSEVLRAVSAPVRSGIYSLLLARWGWGEALPLQPFHSLLPGLGFVSVAVCQATAHGSGSSRLLAPAASVLRPCGGGRAEETAAPGSGRGRRGRSGRRSPVPRAAPRQNRREAIFPFLRPRGVANPEGWFNPGRLLLSCQQTLLCRRMAISY